MGLFSNDKKLCPICGKPTPRLFPTKVADAAICKECDKKINLPDGLLEQMSLKEFEEYIQFYDANQPLRDAFSETYKYDLGFLSGCFVIDMDNRLFRLKNDERTLVMEGANLKSFRIMENDKPIYESGNDVLKCYHSDVPERVNAMSDQVTRFMVLLREYEMLEKMADMHERMEVKDKNNSKPYVSHPTRPYFDTPAPFENFCIELSLAHPYWNEWRWEISAPSFDRECPSIADYLQRYEEAVAGLHAWAANLMQLVCPGASEIYEGGNPMEATRQAMPVQSADNTIEQLKKYKELLDAGILTEEEFTAKKRQLMEI